MKVIVLLRTGSTTAIWKSGLETHVRVKLSRFLTSALPWPPLFWLYRQISATRGVLHLFLCHWHVQNPPPPRPETSRKLMGQWRQPHNVSESALVILWICGEESVLDPNLWNTRLKDIPAAAHGVPANNPTIVLTRPPVLTDVAASHLLSAVQKWDNWLSDCTAEAGSHLLGVIASPLSISHTVCSQELTS